MNNAGISVLKAGFCALFLGIFVLWGTAASGKTSGTAQEGELVPSMLLRKAGLHQEWQIRLPIKTRQREGVDRLFILDQYLLILTNQNYLFCRNRADGSVRFEMQIAEKGLPVVDPLYIDQRIFFIIGSQLKVLDPASGMVLQTEELAEVGENRNASLAKNDRFFYVAGVDRRVHAFRIQEDGDSVKLFTATADNDSTITSLLATDDQVFFSTLAGNVVAMDADGPVNIWQYNTSGAITAPLTLDEGSVYAGGHDTKLYRLSAATGKLQWETPFFAGDKILHAPGVGRTTLYLRAGRSGLYGVSKQSGKDVWNIPGGESVLCESGDRAYVYAVPGVLYVMDNRTGKEVYSLNFSQVNRYTMNLGDARMYLADTRGRVACISVP